MAYNPQAGNSASQPEFIDSIKKDLNPWQEQNNTNNYLGGYHGNAYQEPPVPPQLDPLLQESLWGNFPVIKPSDEITREQIQEHRVTDDGWSEWPDDWGVEDSDECMSNGFSNGFTDQPSYPPQSQITPLQPQLQNSGHFFDQFSAPSQQITQPQKLGVPANSFFDDVQLNNSFTNTQGNTAHFFQDSMASQNQTPKMAFTPFGSKPAQPFTESASVRTGISYAAALTGKTEAPMVDENDKDWESASINNSQFDDINLNDNTDAGLPAKVEELSFSEPEPTLPAASFSPFPAPMPEKMERSAAHLFSQPPVGNARHDFFGSAVNTPIQNNNAFNDRTQAEQQNEATKPNVEESFSFDHQTPAHEEQRPQEMQLQQPEDASKFFGVHSAPSNEVAHPSVGDPYAFSHPTPPTGEQRPSEMPLQQSEEDHVDDNAFGEHGVSKENVHPNIEDAFASSQPFSFPTKDRATPEIPLQQAEEASDMTHSAVKDGHVHSNIADAFASSQPFSFPTKDRATPEIPLQQAEEASNMPYSASTNESGIPNIEDSFAVREPFLFATEEQTAEEVPSQQPEEANGIQEHLQTERSFINQAQDGFSQANYFRNVSDSSGIADAFGIEENRLSQADQQANQVVPDVEESFGFNQPTLSSEEQKPPEVPVQQSEEANDIQDHFGVQTPSHDEPNELLVADNAPNQLAWQKDEPSLEVSEGSDNQVDSVSPRGNINPMSWQDEPYLTSQGYGTINQADFIPPKDDTNQKAFQQGDSSITSPEEASQHNQEDPLASRNTTQQMPWQNVGIMEEVPFGQPSEMVTGEVPRSPKASPNTFETNSSSTPDTSSSSEQSQVEATTWRKEEDDLSNMHHQPSPPTDVVQPPPVTTGKMEADIQNKGIYEQKPSAPPASDVQAPFMATGKVEEDIPVGVAFEHYQPVPSPPTNIVQPPPMTLGNKKADVPDKGDLEQPAQPINVLSPSSLAAGKTEEQIPKRDGHGCQQHAPPSSNIIQPPPMASSRKEEVISRTVGQSAPPPSNIVPSAMVTGKLDQDVSVGVGHQHPQSAPPPLPSNIVPSQMVTGKMDQDVPMGIGHGHPQSALPPPPSNIVPSAMVTGKLDQDVSVGVGHQHPQSAPPPPPSNIVPTPPTMSGREADVPKKVGHNHPTPPLTNITQAPPTTFGKMGASNPRGIAHEQHHTPPTASTYTVSPVFSKAAHGEHVKPAKTSTPEPPLLPESGPMAMTKRPSREEKSRTPISLSSSLWSNAVPTALTPSVKLAPALKQSTMPATPPPPPPSEAVQPKQDLNTPQPSLAEQETKGESLAALSKKERKAEKKRLKALKKEQKKLKQETISTNAENSIVNANVLPSNPSHEVNTSNYEPSNPLIDSTPLSSGNPVGNPHAVQESTHHPSRKGEYHPEKPTRGGDEFGFGREFGNPHRGEARTHYGNPNESIHTPSRESECHDKNVRGDEYGISNLHSREQQQHYGDIRDPAAEKSRRHRDRGYEDEFHYSNPRVRELREESPSRSPQRQSENPSHRDYLHRHDEHDSYHDSHYAGSHVPRTSHEDFHDRSFNSRSSYSQRHENPDDYRYSTSRNYDGRHDPRYGLDYDDRHDRDYRYSTDRRDNDRYRNDSYDHYRRGRSRRDDFDYYSSRRSHEDLSYLNHSYDSVYGHGRPERSSREELESYRNDYHRDGADREGFKPINDPHYPDPYRSNTPSSGSGRSSPAAYNYHHDPYYGYQHHPPHPYPGYEHHYGYYPGPYGMPYHYAPGYYPGYGPYYDYYQQYGHYGSGQGSQYSSGEGSYPDNQANEGQAGESALEKDQEESEVQEVAPLRTTPLHFLRPHMNCRFGPGGQLLVTLPHHPDDGQKPLVQVSKLKAIFDVKELEQIEAFPGPLSCQGTMKRQVIEFVQAKADEIQQSSTDLPSQQARWVLWKFLLSLVKHNGAVVAEDIAETLMLSVKHFEKKKKTSKKKKRKESKSSSSSDSSSDDDSSDDSSSDSSDDEESSEEEDATKPVDHLLVFRGLLLEGKTKEAIEYAMANNLWAHAVLLGGLMDTKTNNSMLNSKTSSSIVSRFFDTLEERDPLKTVYEHLGGKVPHAVKQAANWASNLAGIIANPTAFPDRDKENIITLGDTLGKHPDLLAASHLCYLLAGLKPGSPGTNSKIVLVGCEHRSKKCDKFENIEALHLTELFEYASSLENPEFFLASFQMFRFFHATKLIDAGLHQEALSYLQFVGDLMIKHPHAFNDTMKKNVYKTTEQLVGHMEKSGADVELFVMSWLKKFNNMLEGKDSGISLPPKETESEDEEDVLAKSSMSYFSGYEHQTTHDETTPESTPYSHNTVSRQASIQSTHSVPSVHSLHALDLSKPIPTEMYQSAEPLQHEESFSSQGYQERSDGPLAQEYQERQPTESIDPWHQEQGEQQFVNDMWMPGVTQQNNSWMPSASVEETGHGMPPEGDGETTPVNTATFDDFYRQANPIMSRGTTWEEDNAKTPTPAMPDSSQATTEASESRGKEEKADTKTADNNKVSSGQSSGFWYGITGMVKSLIPKGPKEVHLPDDKEKTIYFDKELNRWVNTEEENEDKAPPPPPPSDAMIGGMSAPPALGPRPGGNPMMDGAPQGMMPPNPTMPTPGMMNTQAEAVPNNNRTGPGAPGVPGPTANQESLPGMIPGMQTPGKPAGPPSKFSRKAQGRLGSRNKYVDVLNPNKGSQQSPQAVPAALFPIMPAGGGTFQGTLFVPSAAPVNNDDDNNSSQPPTEIQSGPDNAQPPSPTHSRTSSLGSQSTVSLASAEVRSYFEGQEQKENQNQTTQPQQPTFFDPSSFQPQAPSTSRRGRGRYPGGYNK